MFYLLTHFTHYDYSFFHLEEGTLDLTELHLTIDHLIEAQHCLSATDEENA